MMTEARSGFTAFNEGPKDDREVDFVLLRQKLAAGQSWVGRCTTRSSRGAKQAWLSHPPLKVWLERDGALLRLRWPPQGQHLRRADDRRAAGGAGRAPRPRARCAACCSTPRARTSASAPASRSTWPSAAPACWPRCTR
jgi:hypothetical protein